MRETEDDGSMAESAAEQRGVRCQACESALETPGRDTISFLLLDQLTVPLVGCADHKRRFGEVCGLTSEHAATLIQHRPAGGVRCPGCRHSTHRPQRPVVPVEGGAVAVLSCPRHADAIVGRFRAGLRTQQRLTASLPSW
jgi:DNA-directed RNA polymerase subunit RPC12/RpoP